MTSDAEVRAAAAKRLIEDPLLKEAFAAVRQGAIDAWASTGAGDSEAREVAWMTVKVLDRIEGELASVIANGRIAAARVQRPPLR